MNPTAERLVRLAGILTAVSALAAAVFFFGPVPCQDDWILVPIVDKIMSGQTPWADLWAFHNEHRLFFPKLILSYWAVWTHWQLSGTALLDLALVAGACFLLARVGAPNRTSTAFWAACIFVLSLRTTKVALWPIMLSAWLCAAAAVSAYAWTAMRPRSAGRWIAAAGLCAVSAFSFAGGIFSWIAAAILWRPLWKDRLFWPVVLGWMSVSAACLALYFDGYSPAPGNPLFTLVLQEPLSFIQFFLTYIGSVFHPMPAPLFGAVGLFLAVRLIVSALRTGSASACGLSAICLFVLINGLAISAARLCFGLQTAASDRYLPVSAFLWAAAAVFWVSEISASAGPRPRAWRLLPALLIGCVLSMAPGHAVVGYRFKESHRWAESILRKDHPAPDEMAVIFYRPERLPELIKILKERKLSVFREET